MPGRPYLKSSIVDLERLFETENDNRELLRALHEELTYRSTSRARSLKMKVEQRLAHIDVAALPVVEERLELAGYVNAKNLGHVLRFCANVTGSPNDQIICEAGGLKFVDPVGLCLLAATCHRLATLGKKLRLESLPPDIVDYLARMDLFKACGIQYAESFIRHNRQESLVEICIADKASEVDALAAKIAAALVGATPDYDPSAKPDEMTGFLPHEYLYKPLHYIFSELLENALTHAKRAGYGNARAWVAAQYYPAIDRIQLAVVDDGCGFLGSLAKDPRLSGQGHEAAIRLACEPRVTCNPDLEVRPDETANQGIGLTVVREIARRGQGTIRLVSGDALVEQMAKSDRSRRIPRWQGVVLALTFKRDLLRKVNVSQIIHELRGGSAGLGLRFE